VETVTINLLKEFFPYDIPARHATGSVKLAMLLVLDGKRWKLRVTMSPCDLDANPFLLKIIIDTG
jgi:hypothetical protein